MDTIMNYSWPGNIRELENVIKRMIVLETDQIEIQSGNMPTEKAHSHSTPFSTPPASSYETVETPLPASRKKEDNLKDAVRQITQKAEEETIRRILHETRWNRKNAAKILGVSYKTLLQKIKLFNLNG